MYHILFYISFFGFWIINIIVAKAIGGMDESNNAFNPSVVDEGILLVAIVLALISDSDNGPGAANTVMIMGIAICFFYNTSFYLPKIKQEKLKHLAYHYDPYPEMEIPYPDKDDPTIFYAKCAIYVYNTPCSPYYNCMIWRDKDYLYITPVKSMEAGENHVARIACADIKCYYSKFDNSIKGTDLYVPSNYDRSHPEKKDVDETVLYFVSKSHDIYVLFLDYQVDNLRKIIGERKIDIPQKAN